MQADPPLITPAPDAVLVARILMRQADEAVICGYVDGSSNSPVTCAAGSTCASNLVNSVHFCCQDPKSCVLPTTCYAATDVSNGICDDSCLENSSILKCTFVEDSYCYTRSWLGSTPLSGFGCAPTPFKEDVLSGITTPSDTTASPTTGTSTTPTGISHHNSPFLSKGAIVGIAVGCFIFICILIALAVPKSRKWMFVIFRSHKSPTDSASEGAELRSNYEADPFSQRIRAPSVLSGPSVYPRDTGRYETY